MQTETRITRQPDGLVLVTLTEEEEWLADRTGMRRIEDSKKRRITHRFDEFKRGDAQETNIQGAGAEIAVSRFMRQHWAGEQLGWFGKPDIGTDVEVRWRDVKVGPDIGLPTKGHHNDWRYVLVHGYLPDYIIVGWLWGREADEMATTRKDYDTKHGTETLRFVPPHNLRKAVELA